MDIKEVARKLVKAHRAYVLARVELKKKEAEMAQKIRNNPEEFNQSKVTEKAIEEILYTMMYPERSRVAQLQNELFAAQIAWECVKLERGFPAKEEMIYETPND